MVADGVPSHGPDGLFTHVGHLRSLGLVTHDRACRDHGEFGVLGLLG